MAIPTGTAWEIRTTGSDTQGGSFSLGVVGVNSVDYSQQNAAQVSVTDAVTVGSTSITSVTGGFDDTMIGNGVNLAGTVYAIVAVPNANTLTVDRNTGTAIGQTAKVGGALASLGFCLGQSSVSNLVWIKAGTYLVTSATANIAAGRANEAQGGTAAARFRVRGYQTTRGDNTGTKPIIRASGVNNFTLWTSSAQNETIENVTFDGAVATGILGMDVQVSDVTINSVTISNCHGGAAVLLGRVFAIGCLFDTCGQDGANYSVIFGGGVGLYDCVWSACAHSLNGNGTAEGSVVRCLILNQSNNADVIYLETGSAGKGYRIEECTIRGGPGNGIGCANAQSTVVNCLITDIVGTAILSTASDAMDVVNCAFFNNGTNITGVGRAVGTVTLSADPYVSAAGGNYAPNATSGGGAAIRGAAFGNAPPGLSSTAGGLDIGAVQHVDSGASGMLYIPNLEGI